MKQGPATQKKSHYTRKTTLGIPEAMELIRHPAKTVVKLGGVGCRVKSSGYRLKTFSEHGTICVGCQLEASFFAVERSGQKGRYHLNLYGMKNGQEVLFTHDHILARSLGGADNLQNTQTMCYPCNHRKSKTEHIPLPKTASEKPKMYGGNKILIKWHNELFLELRRGAENESSEVF